MNASPIPKIFSRYRQATQEFLQENIERIDVEILDRHFLDDLGQAHPFGGGGASALLDSFGVGLWRVDHTRELIGYHELYSGYFERTGPPSRSIEQLRRRMVVPMGLGTIGFVVDHAAEYAVRGCYNVDDAEADLRGAVSLEDRLLGHRNVLLCPVSPGVSGGGIELILSLFVAVPSILAPIASEFLKVVQAFGEEFSWAFESERFRLDRSARKTSFPQAKSLYDEAIKIAEGVSPGRDEAAATFPWVAVIQCEPGAPTSHRGSSEQLWRKLDFEAFFGAEMLTTKRALAELHDSIDPMWRAGAWIEPSWLSDHLEDVVIGVQGQGGRIRGMVRFHVFRSAKSEEIIPQGVVETPANLNDILTYLEEQEVRGGAAGKNPYLGAKLRHDISARLFSYVFNRLHQERDMSIEGVDVLLGAVDFDSAQALLDEAASASRELLNLFCVERSELVGASYWSAGRSVVFPRRGIVSTARQAELPEELLLGVRDAVNLLIVALDIPNEEGDWTLLHREHGTDRLRSPGGRLYLDFPPGELSFTELRLHRHADGTALLCLDLGAGAVEVKVHLIESPRLCCWYLNLAKRDVVQSGELPIARYLKASEMRGNTRGQIWDWHWSPLEGISADFRGAAIDVHNPRTPVLRIQTDVSASASVGYRLPLEDAIPAVEQALWDHLVSRAGEHVRHLRVIHAIPLVVLNHVYAWILVGKFTATWSTYATQELNRLSSLARDATVEAKHDLLKEILNDDFTRRDFIHTMLQPLNTVVAAVEGVQEASEDELVLLRDRLGESKERLLSIVRWLETHDDKLSRFKAVIKAGNPISLSALLESAALTAARRLRVKRGINWASEFRSVKTKIGRLKSTHLRFGLKALSLLFPVLVDIVTNAAEHSAKGTTPAFAWDDSRMVLSIENQLSGHLPDTAWLAMEQISRALMLPTPSPRRYGRCFGLFNIFYACVRLRLGVSYSRRENRVACEVYLGRWTRGENASSKIADL